MPLASGGTQIASTGQIVDGAIETADIADNQITLAKLAHGTQGGLMYYGASGAPTELAASTSGYYLQTKGAGANPEWAAVAANPAGVIVAYGGAAAPTGWLLCDGSAVNRTTYADLFTAISTAYGVGDGSTTFNVPDLRGRVAVGKSADTEFDTLGETGGAKTHTLTEAQIPSHSHQFTCSASGSQDGSGYPVLHSASPSPTVTTTTTGGGTAHNNLQPYQVINYIIKI